MNAEEARRLQKLFDVRPLDPYKPWLLFEISQVFKEIAERLELKEEFESLEDFTD